MTGAQDSIPEPSGGGRVLVVEDDVHIRDLVVLHLKLEGLTAVAAGTGSEGLRLAKMDPFDLLILDVMLPELDGVTVCRAVRRESMNGDVPILMLTARREEADKVLGLESGADDYLTKPFGIREFIARVTSRGGTRGSGRGPAHG
jgi:two-component system, OmpR family, alkaline phosphatase synthesis response regulator PhoP